MTTTPAPTTTPESTLAYVRRELARTSDPSWRRALNNLARVARAEIAAKKSA